MCLRDGSTAVIIVASKFQVVMDIMMKHCRVPFLLGHPAGSSPSLVWMHGEFAAVKFSKLARSVDSNKPLNHIAAK